jgi:hypothetical protein
MKPSTTFNHAAKGLLSLIILFVCPLLLLAQSKKSTTSAPSRSNTQTKSAPAPQQPRPSTPQQRGATPTAGKGGTPTAGKGGTPTAGKGGTPTAGKGGTPIAGKGGAPTTGKGGTPTVGKGGAPTTGKGGTSTTAKRPTPAPYVSRPGDHQARALTGGRTEFRNANGQTVTTNARGEVQRIEAPRGLSGGNKMVINRGPGGGRIVETGHPGARVVNYGPNRGFVERPLRQGYISRTYVAGGRSYARVYREYRYHDVVYYHYVPAYYYGPEFYAWAVTPWSTPMPYAWFGLATPAPWFGFYAGYFAPYRTYASADLWLTDYLVAENLRLAYENQQADNGNQGPPPPANVQPNSATLSPEMKALIADEVRQQLAAEKAAAAQPESSSPQQPAPGAEQLPPALTQKFFVVSSNLDITTAAGRACSLTPGDIIQRKGTEVMADGGVVVEVVSSKPGDCDADSGATVQLVDLQEMHNRFREQLDSGLKTLAENQAKGLPSGPAAGVRGVAEGTADPVSDAQAQLLAQDADAARLEAQVRPN